MTGTAQLGGSYMTTELVDHTLDWVRGEMHESAAIAVLGTTIAVTAGLFWFLTDTLYTRSLVLPLLVIGAIPMFYGVSGYFSSRESIEVYQSLWAENPEAFVVSEKRRVEGFDNIF